MAEVSGERPLPLVGPRMSVKISMNCVCVRQTLCDTLAVGDKRYRTESVYQ